MKNSPLKLGNINKYCKHHFIDGYLLNVKIKTKDRRIGALPYDWLKDFNPRKYSRITRKVDDLFIENLQAKILLI